MKHFLTSSIISLFITSNSVLAQSQTELTQVKIGNQIWMQHNLDVVQFRNGDEVFHAKTNKEWKQAAKEKRAAWCYYNNDPKFGEEYGKLYNWYAVNDSRGLAPNGWKVPSDTDWATLVNNTGGIMLAGAKLKEAGLNHWKSDPHATSTNESGFTALPGGYVNEGPNSTRVIKNSIAYFWTSTPKGKNAYCWIMTYAFPKVTRSYLSHRMGMSVRCIKEH